MRLFCAWWVLGCIAPFVLIVFFINVWLLNRLSFRGLWMGMITKWTPFLSSNMYVRHGIFLFFYFWHKTCELYSWNDLQWWNQTLYNTPHITPLLHPQNYDMKTSNAIGDPPRLWLVRVIKRAKILGFQPNLLCTQEFVGSQKQYLGQPHGCICWIKGWN